MMVPPMKNHPATAPAWIGRRVAFATVIATCIAMMGWLTFFTPPALVQAATPQRLFWVVDNGVYRHIPCDDVASGTRITLFDCGEPDLAPRDAESIVQAFDHHIYPTDIQEFGAPRRMGQIDVVLAPFTGMTFGYFDQNDLQPGGSSAAAHSNHGNVLYVRSLALMPDADKMADVQEALAHELQHLIDFRIRVLDHRLAPQEVWLNEGLSFFAQISNGYWTPRDTLRVQASASDPAWSLTAMTENSQFLKEHGRVAYGRAGMFVTYLAAQNGTRFTRAVVRNRQTGLRGVDAVLRQEHRGTCADAFAHWGVAQLLNEHGQYGYHGLLGEHSVLPHLTYPTVTSYPFNTQVGGHTAMTLQPWTQRYVRFSTALGSPVGIRIAAPSGVRLAAVYGTSSGSPNMAVRWLKQAATHAVTIDLGAFGQRYDTVTLIVSATGSLDAFPLDSRAAVIRIEATSIYSRHYQGVSRPAPPTGQDANVAL
jgi:hypothetical protein